MPRRVLYKAAHYRKLPQEVAQILRKRCDQKSPTFDGKLDDQENNGTTLFNSYRDADGKLICKFDPFIYCVNDWRWSYAEFSEAVSDWIRSHSEFDRFIMYLEKETFDALDLCSDFVRRAGELFQTFDRDCPEKVGYVQKTGDDVVTCECPFHYLHM